MTGGHGISTSPEGVLVRHSRRKLIKRTIPKRRGLRGRLGLILATAFITALVVHTTLSLDTWPHENAALVQATVTGPYHISRGNPLSVGTFTATLDSGASVKVTVASALKVWDGGAQVGRMALSGIPEFPKGAPVVLQEEVSRIFDRRRYSFVALVAENVDSSISPRNTTGDQ